MVLISAFIIAKLWPSLIFSTIWLGQTWIWLDQQDQPTIWDIHIVMLHPLEANWTPPNIICNYHWLLGYYGQFFLSFQRISLSINLIIWSNQIYQISNWFLAWAWCILWFWGSRNPSMTSDFNLNQGKTKIQLMVNH